MGSPGSVSSCTASSPLRRGSSCPWCGSVTLFRVARSCGCIAICLVLRFRFATAASYSSTPAAGQALATELPSQAAPPPKKQPNSPTGLLLLSARSAPTHVLLARPSEPPSFLRPKHSHHRSPRLTVSILRLH